MLLGSPPDMVRSAPSHRTRPFAHLNTQACLTEVIYGIKVSTGVNQTLIWKVLKKVCENKDEEGIRIANELKEKYPETFSGAVRCLVSKKRINYIDSIC